MDINMDILVKYLIIFSITYAIFFASIIFFMFYRYYYKKKEAGMIITTIKRPFEVLCKKIGTYIILFIFMNTRFPSITNIGIAPDLLLMLPTIYSFIALILLAWFDLQPQQIYQNGILVSTGFIKWASIQYVESSDPKGHIIKITLQKNRFGSNTLKLYCFPGLSSNFVDLITSKLNNN